MKMEGEEAKLKKSWMEISFNKNWKKMKKKSVLRLADVLRWCDIGWAQGQEEQA